MKFTATHLFKTAAGKVLAAVLVVTTGVGAAAAGAEMSLFTTAADEVEEPAEDVEEPEEPADDGQADDDDDGQDEDGQDDDGADDDGSDDDGTDDGTDDDADDDADDGDDDAESAALAGEEDEDPNHGEVVSTFVHETELTGCEKGQATAAVARGDVDPTDAEIDLDEALAPYIEKCSKGDPDADADAESDGDDDGEPGDGAPWKQQRDEGRTEVDEAREAYVEACGDDDDDDADETESGEADEPKSEECQALHDAMKQAHADWKDDWHAARDEAKQQRRAGDDEATAETDERRGPPDHAQGNGKNSGSKGSNGKSNGQGKGKP